MGVKVTDMRTMTIEKALVWTYREELPKEPRPGGAIKAGGMPAVWERVSRFGELLELVDESGLNRWGVVPDPTANAGPHADAIRIHKAVVALDALDLDIPEGWSPLEDCGMGDDAGPAVARGLAQLRHVDRAGRPRLKYAPRLLVQRCAILGAPSWDGEAPVKREVTAHGKPLWFRRSLVDLGDGQHYEIEVDGYDAKRKRPYPDAYRKFVYEPDPADLALDRALYEVWRASLDVLAADLDGALDTIAVLPSAMAARPWEARAPEPRILPNLGAPMPVAAGSPRLRMKVAAAS